MEPEAKFEIIQDPQAPRYTQEYVTSLRTRYEQIVSRVESAARKEAWAAEMAAVRIGGGSRDWSRAERQELIAGRVPSGYFMHHIKPVAQYPELAGSLSNLTPVSYREHALLHGWNINE